MIKLIHATKVQGKEIARNHESKEVMDGLRKAVSGRIAGDTWRTLTIPMTNVHRIRSIQISALKK